MSNKNWQDKHLADVTEIMREADRVFESVGGSTRHYIRDCLFPLLEQKGFIITTFNAGDSLTEDKELETLKAENSKMRQALDFIRIYTTDQDGTDRVIHNAATEALKTP